MGAFFHRRVVNLRFSFCSTERMHALCESIEKYARLHCSSREWEMLRVLKRTISFPAGLSCLRGRLYFVFTAVLNLMGF